MRNGSSIIGLVKELKQEVKRFVGEEIQLAKHEMSEKLSSFGGHSVSIAIGGFVAYAGAIVFLGGLGALLAYVFGRIGLELALASFAGVGLIGLLVVATGVVILMRGIA